MMPVQRDEQIVAENEFVCFFNQTLTAKRRRYLYVTHARPIRELLS